MTSNIKTINCSVLYQILREISDSLAATCSNIPTSLSLTESDRKCAVGLELSLRLQLVYGGRKRHYKSFESERKQVAAKSLNYDMKLTSNLRKDTYN